jgi:hypothetical protein
LDAEFDEFDNVKLVEEVVKKDKEKTNKKYNLAATADHHRQRKKFESKIPVNENRNNVRIKPDMPEHKVSYSRSSIPTSTDDSSLGLKTKSNRFLLQVDGTLTSARPKVSERLKSSMSKSTPSFQQEAMFSAIMGALQEREEMGSKGHSETGEISVFDDFQ